MIMDNDRPKIRPKQNKVNGRCYLCGNEVPENFERCEKCYPKMNIQFQFEFPKRTIYVR